jgi:hypothetical protein
LSAILRRKSQIRTVIAASSKTQLRSFALRFVSRDESAFGNAVMRRSAMESGRTTTVGPSLFVDNGYGEMVEQTYSDLTNATGQMWHDETAFYAWLKLF